MLEMLGLLVLGSKLMWFALPKNLAWWFCGFKRNRNKIIFFCLYLSTHQPAAVPTIQPFCHDTFSLIELLSWRVGNIKFCPLLLYRLDYMFLACVCVQWRHLTQGGSNDSNHTKNRSATASSLSVSTQMMRALQNVITRHPSQLPDHHFTPVEGRSCVTQLHSTWFCLRRFPEGFWYCAP